ncbi:endo-1,4-beta-xylanase/feruloyl esterase [Candidatus Phycosocius bacilliformis]|uniref:Endo-1,4-beta-xylanase/feruloyl esterase n=1 Tax=Candidatus Phycosocius bacilliformis TaxID=1445552 RepID=A0A2P2E5L1_9PROT|nr:alpha/beta hydrolase-fold protein [Candidatus Phycosocius bacilliformis]GBF56350.1 endo-1,4-beta-xylanase/feruloyl esterase [Candidatus Phycosocius bacilliformis]
MEAGKAPLAKAGKKDHATAEPVSSIRLYYILTGERKQMMAHPAASTYVDDLTRRQLLGGGLISLGFLTNCAGSESPLSTRSAQVRILDPAMDMPTLRRKRRIWLYLPADYGHSTTRYPVIYMQDGQNLFDRATSYAGEWQVDETLDRLQKAGDSGAIVVGIDNGGADRTAEYHPILPWPEVPGQADAYLAFLTDHLKPLIDRRFRTKPDATNTAIMGASSGGTLALYGGIMRPDVFGKVGAFSTPLWLKPRLDDLARQQKCHRPGAKVFLTCGRDEKVGNDPPGMFARDVPAMIKALSEIGYDPRKDIMSRIVEDGTHGEAFWAREFVIAYQFLMAG